MEGTMPMIMEGTRPPTGASPTQPYKCGQNVKVNVKIPLSTNGAQSRRVGAELVYLGVSQNFQPLHRALRRYFGGVRIKTALTLTLTLNILTAFIRLG